MTPTTTSSGDVISVAQLSDTHFLEDGAEPEGGFSYDTAEAFEAVRQHMASTHRPDLVVVTGDVADHGRPAQYRKAADAFATLDAPVNVCPGNHDFDVTFTASIGRPNVASSRMIEAGAWAFLFVDTCAGLMEPDEDGVPTDPAGEARLHSNGNLGRREQAEIRELVAAAEAEHVFVWLHHPPAVPLGMFHNNVAYDAEWTALLTDLPKIKGLGGGHTHVPDEWTFEGRPVFVAPALKNNFSMEPQTWLPPGYRTYDFHADGTVTSEVQLVDDERWPRRPFGRAIASLFRGELTFEELAEIVARSAENKRSD